MSAPIDRIRELLTTLPGLPQFWREDCIAVACQLPAIMQTRYLKENLEPLDKYFRPSAEIDGPLREYCKEFEQYYAFPSEMVTKLGIHTTKNIIEGVNVFLQLAQISQLDPARCASYAMCSIASPFLYEVRNPLSRGYDYALLAKSLIACSNVSNGVGFMESVLGVTESDYVDDTQMKQRLNSRHLHERVPEASIRSQCLEALGYGLLHDVDRKSCEVVVLLESFLSIDVHDYSTPSSLHQALVRSNIISLLPDPAYRAAFFLVLADALMRTSTRDKLNALYLLFGYVDVTINEQFQPDEEVLGKTYTLFDLNEVLGDILVCNYVYVFSLALLHAQLVSLATRYLEKYFGLSRKNYAGIDELGSAIVQSIATRDCDGPVHIPLLLLLLNVLKDTPDRFWDCHVLGHALAGVEVQTICKKFRVADLEFDNRTFLECQPVAGNPSGACAVLEIMLGLHEKDYGQLDLLKKKLQGDSKNLVCTDYMRPLFVVALADSLAIHRRNGALHAVNVLESFSGLSISDYSSRDLLRAKLASLEMCSTFQDPLGLGVLLACLASLLRLASGRQDREAVDLLEVYVGLEQADYTDSIHMVTRLRDIEFTKRLPSPSIRCQVLNTLGDALRMAPGRGFAEATLLLETHADIEPQDYSSRDDIIEMLQSKAFMDAVPSAEQRGRYLCTLADALRIAPNRGSEQGLYLLECYIGFTVVDYTKQDDLRVKLMSEPLVEKLPNIAERSNYILHLGQLLRSSNSRSAVQAVVLLESYLGINCNLCHDKQYVQDMLESEEVSEKLPDLVGRAFFIQELSESLLATDRQGVAKAVMLLESYLGIDQHNYRDITGMQDLFKSEQFAQKLPDLNNRTLFIQTLVEALLNATSRSNADAFLVLQGYLCVPLSDFYNAPVLAESPIYNRVLFATACCNCLTGTHSVAIALCRSVITYISLVRDDQLPTYRHRLEFLSESRKIWPELQRLANERIEHERSLGNEAEAEDLERELMLWAEQFKNRLLVERLFTEGTFLGTDGASALEGWSPWRPTLESDPGGEQPESDTLSSELSLLTLRSDRQSESVIVEPSQKQGDASRLSRGEMLQSDKTLEELIPQNALYVRVLFDNETSASGLRWWAWRNEASGVQKITSGVSDEGARGILEQAVETFDRAVKSYEEGAKSECAQTEQKKLELEGQARRERWDNDQHEAARQELDEELHQRTDSLHKSLQTAFGHYVCAMNNQLDLSELDTKGEDIVLHVEGPLLAMPLAWLRGAEGAFWKIAESTSVSVSLTLQHVSQQFTEPLNKKALFAYPEEPLKKTCIDTALQLGETWERWRLGEDQPEATVANLRAALNAEHRFGLVFIHAHGDRDAGAILQGNQAWDGRGADLRHTDVLFFACCSTGRLSDKGASEVEGQYALIAEHRGRTVVAARWPVGIEPTQRLSVRFAQAYDRATELASSTPFAKARAFALARREALRDSSLPSDEAFIAAFEIYGNA